MFVDSPPVRLHSYVLDHDYGFAPNPFHGFCTLATCKPMIREHAAVGDFIVGTGCAKRRRRGYLVYFMGVAEITNYDAYWRDPRFEGKRPFLRGSKMRAFGDNIYHRDPVSGAWQQANSLHSQRDGTLNPVNVAHDTKSEKVLIGTDFAYWGGHGPQIPDKFRDCDGFDVCAMRGHRNRFPDTLRDQFIDWLRSLGAHGYVAAPLDWNRTA